MSNKIVKRKNIALICSSFHETAGGLERQILLTCKSLLKKNQQVFLMSYDNKGALPFYKIPSGVIWIKCGNNLEPHKSATKFERLKQILNLRKILIKNNINTLITFHHGIFPRSLLASLFLPIKLIVSERNSLDNYKYIKLSIFNVGFFSMFFANKITVQLMSYKKKYPYPLRKKIIVINNFIKEPFEEYREPPFNNRKISMIGRLCNQKNFQPLLNQIISNENKEEIFVEIAGEGILRNHFESKYSHLLNSKKLRLLGNVDDIDSFLSKSSIFCLPSLWEGYPNALSESLRHSLPVVISKRLSHLSEFVEHEVNGLVVDEKDLLRAIVYLFKNPKILRSMSHESYRKYKILYKEKPINKWLEII